jgi:hypothetical protein
MCQGSPWGRDISQCIELVFLPLAIPLADFVSLPVKQRSRHAVAAFATVELHQNAPPVGFIVDVLQQKGAFNDPAQLLQCPCQLGGSIPALQGAYERLRGKHAERQ